MLNRDVKILENIRITIILIPSIIDYAINIGLKETSDQWMKFLLDDGFLDSKVYLNSHLDTIQILKNL